MKLEPEIIRSDLTNDEYHLYHHPSGLDILIMKMEGFTTTEALFATKYGSVNNCFKTKNSDEFIHVPDGIAHYLEHKLFENEECGVFELYAKTGAMANAFTSFNITGYTFSASSDYKEPLRILLDFVQKPYFTDENVEKERGIIAQEIKMTNDSPSRALFYELLKSLYHIHPVKIDIGGTVESINEITTELLYQCYNTFYNLHNMVLSIAGNVDDIEVLKICDEYLKPCENIELQTLFPDEPYGVVRKRSHIKRQVGIPIFTLGFKCDVYSGYELEKKSLAADLMLRMLFGPMSIWYKEAFEAGLINSTFGTEVFSASEGYFVIMLTGESKYAEDVYASICLEIEHIRSRPLDENLFKTLLRGCYGNEVMKLNLVSECAETMCLAYMQDMTGFDTLKILSELTIEDISDAIRLLDIDRASFCTVSDKDSFDLK